MNQNNQGPDGASWGGQGSDDFRKQPSYGSTSSAKDHNPFAGGKSGPPVFYRSKAGDAPATEQRDTQPESNRASNPPSAPPTQSKSTQHILVSPLKVRP